ncbi:MAG: phage tail tube protein [Candidatus Anammoxibacter sp.]
MAASIGILNGTTLLLYVDGVAIGGTTSHSMSESVAMRDATTKDSGGKEEVLPGTYSASISFDGFVAYDATYGWTDLHDLIVAKTKVALKFSTENADDDRYKGDAYLESLDKEASTEENVGFSGSFKITGGISKETIT